VERDPGRDDLVDAVQDVLAEHRDWISSPVRSMPRSSQVTFAGLPAADSVKPVIDLQKWLATNAGIFGDLDRADAALPMIAGRTRDCATRLEPALGPDLC
jgi:hypothetical protein